MSIPTDWSPAEREDGLAGGTRKLVVEESIFNFDYGGFLHQMAAGYPRFAKKPTAAFQM